MDKLKLIAFDAEDLAVVSAHTQDAVLKVADMAYQRQERRFVALLRRYDWAQEATGGKVRPVRRQTALRFERVLAVRYQGLDLKARGEVLSLLAIQFAPKAADDPAGDVTLVFAGGGAIKLDVECIEAELRDLGPKWQARSRPRHPDQPDAPAPASGPKKPGGEA